MGRIFYILCLAFSLLCVAIFFLSCTKGYRIKGTSDIQSIDGKTITLKASHNGEWRTLDSCEIIHGKFRMKGKTDTTLITTLFLDGEAIMPMILEPGDIDITVSNIRLKAEGTRLNDSLYQFIARKYRLDLRAIELERMEAQMIMNGHDQPTIQHRMDSTYQSLRNEMHSLVLSFIGKNYDNALSLCGFSMLCNGLPYPIITPLIQAVIDDAPKAFLEHPTISKFLRTAHENTERYGVAEANYQ